MVTIATCDDDLIYLAQIAKYLSELADEQKLRYETFSNASDLISAIRKQNDKFDIILLDINIDTDNGIEVAKQIRKFNEDLLIIFITSFLEYAPDGYGVKAFRYILKPIDPDILKAEIIAAIKELDKNKVLAYSVTSKGLCKTIPVKDIVYFESSNRKVTIKDVNGDEIEFYEKLDDIEKQEIFKNFIRPHQSFLVNILHINYIEKNARTIVLKDNGRVPISRSKIDQVIKKYITGLKKL